MFNKLEQFKDTLSKMKDMKKNMAAAQKRISMIRVTASAGAGMVNVTVSGDGIITNVKINKELFEGDDVKMLEDLVLSASNEAIKKSKEAMAHELKAVTGGVDPGDLGKMMGLDGD
ncbi:MAG TPA: YbaB/EbfC family nucleoid-associated protein [Leptospiraceae bacterium]|nr:YbaB/EbfC family nucleoid-associated protein [Leptospiraceae bacterium]HNF13373.1 YbaB/EbfC family nucleoid-associated protein [Leptospiraceae bacterium]HNF28161.1 YbaB/EbfC family nucleoid-associated protein [Leptospiraceae bacterium]HNI24913.1 YbaB/EbfC family nucleoid-associated protein [Leptospiraceae bacterium]HNI97580.1 YbaB/EbfC family nucleoid-associated protein [Leptospiraceae bacterium]